MILALKNILFTLVVPGTVGVYLPLILARGRNAATNFFLGLAIIFFVIGGSIYSWCVFDFASFGRGTPAPIDAPKKLVRRGLYRYSRNPMYIGVLTVTYGWALETVGTSGWTLGTNLYICVAWHDLGGNCRNAFPTRV